MELAAPILKYRVINDKLEAWNILANAERIAENATVSLNIKEWSGVFFWFKKIQKAKGVPEEEDRRKIYTHILDTIARRGKYLVDEMESRNIDIKLICGFRNSAFKSLLSEIEMDVYCNENPLSNKEMEDFNKLFNE